MYCPQRVPSLKPLSVDENMVCPDGMCPPALLPFSSALKMEVGDYPETLGPTTKLQDVTSPADSNLTP